METMHDAETVCANMHTIGGYNSTTARLSQLSALLYRAGHRVLAADIAAALKSHKRIARIAHVLETEPV